MLVMSQATRGGWSGKTLFPGMYQNALAGCFLIRDNNQHHVSGITDSSPMENAGTFSNSAATRAASCSYLTT